MLCLVFHNCQLSSLSFLHYGCPLLATCDKIQGAESIYLNALKPANALRTWGEKKNNFLLVVSLWVSGRTKKVKGEGQRKRKAEERRKYKIRTPEVIFIYSKRGSKSIGPKEKAISILSWWHLKLYLIFKDTLKEAIMPTISQLSPCVYNFSLVFVMSVKWQQIVNWWPTSVHHGWHLKEN